MWFELLRDPETDKKVATGAIIGGGIALGVGAAALGTGIALLVAGDDPDRWTIELPDELALRTLAAPGWVGVEGSF
jgi:hypothetical protein